VHLKLNYRFPKSRSQQIDETAHTAVEEPLAGAGPDRLWRREGAVTDDPIPRSVCGNSAAELSGQMIAKFADYFRVDASVLAAEF